jgi:hypothetical protein
MKHITTVAILLAATTSLAAADSKRAPTDAKLAQLVGRWEGKSEFKIKGKSSTWKFTSSCERAAIGPAVICSMVGTSGDMQLEEMWMLAYDQHSETYHLFMTNSWGEAYDHAATWTDASTVSFVHKGTRDKKTLVENYTITFEDDSMTLKGALAVGGKVIGEGVSTSKRVK